MERQQTRSVGRRAVPPLAQFGERASLMPLQPSNRRLGLLVSRFEQGGNLGPMYGSNTVRLGTANGVVRARTIKRLPPSERRHGSFLNEAHGRELARNELEDGGGRVGIRGSEHLCCNHTRQFLHHLCCLNFDRCDERHHTELISNSLGAQTVALGVPTQGAGRKQEVDRSEQCRRQSWRPPLKGCCDWSEPGSVLLSLPRNRVVAMRAKEEQPRAPPASKSLGVGCPKQQPGRW